jgi:hypothetical protein
MRPHQVLAGRLGPLNLAEADAVWWEHGRAKSVAAIPQSVQIPIGDS